MPPKTVEGHLSREALQRLGKPDLTLVLGSSRFPVHKSLVCSASGVLASLIKDFPDQDELPLPSGGGGKGTDAGQPPAGAGLFGAVQLPAAAEAAPAPAGAGVFGAVQPPAAAAAAPAPAGAGVFGVYQPPAAAAPAPAPAGAGVFGAIQPPAAAAAAPAPAGAGAFGVYQPPAAANGFAAAAARFGANQVSAAISCEERIGRMLKQVYGVSISLESAHEAMAMLELADYWDCRAVLPAADTCLALEVQSGRAAPLQWQSSGNHSFGSVPRFSPSWDHAKLLQFIRLASKHKLRRLMATCLPLLWALTGSSVQAAVAELDAPVAQALLLDVASCNSDVLRSAEKPACNVCKTKLRLSLTFWASHICEICKAVTMQCWSESAQLFERELLRRGWGCS